METAPAPVAVRCSFIARVQAGTDPATWHYRRIWVEGAYGDGALRTPHPPSVGDLIALYAGKPDHKRTWGVYRVLARQWLHPGYGSANWKHGTPNPSEGPQLDIVVERDRQGMYPDRAPEDPEDLEDDDEQEDESP